MAARRLIIVMGVLFAISIAAAAIAPQRPITASTESSTTTALDLTGSTTGGAEVNELLPASPSSPSTVRANVGDQLSLTVSAPRPLEVEIADFGLIANAAPAAPAIFNVLLRDPGSVAITDASSGRVIGRLVVRPAPPEGRS